MDSNYRIFVQRLYQSLLRRPPEDGALEHWVAQLKAGLGMDKLVYAFLDSDEFKTLRPVTHQLFVPPGHFYSPIVSPSDIRHLYESPPNPSSVAAIDIDSSQQLRTWKKLERHLRSIPFADEKTPGFRYHFNNPAFGCGDGSILHAMLREHRPARLIEIGSGYSSACAMDTIDHFLNGSVQVTFIEPYPQLLVELLGQERVSQCTLHAQGVQRTDVELFQTLESGDFLFIDSTHVMKTGSDVCHELFEILPTLKPGVFIHFHDVFWPFEYPRDWAIEQNRSWNELYGLRAFLMYNEAFEVEFFNDYFVKNFGEVVEKDYPAMLRNSGASLWLRKKS